MNRGIPALLIACAVIACGKSEQRDFREVPPAGSPISAVRESELEPGGAIHTESTTVSYLNNAYALAEGKALFNSMNCVGCHFHGGGGIGPPLMDDEWIYGSAPQQIFSTIADGRPNGMPAWKFKLSDQQIWQLVSYVRSLSSLNPKGARGGRERPAGLAGMVPESSEDVERKSVAAGSGAASSKHLWTRILRVRATVREGP
jgi:cytochrome c oxidase cbb3-type subunit 3